MKKVNILFLLLVIHFASYGQRDTANVLHVVSPAVTPPDKFRINTTLAHFQIHDGTFSYRSGDNGGVANPGFFKKTGWNSSPYKAGYLDSASNFRMNYRYLEPQGWDPTYSPGYPLVVMLEGAVERANCYTNISGTQCYYGTKTYQPHFPIGSNGYPATITQTNRNNLFNNDHQLLNGGVPHLNARNNAGGKLPNDPSLPAKSFPGFVLFPQMLNGWDGFQSTTAGAWKSDINDMIRIVRLMIKKYNIDPNRIYIHGLSNGGRGVLTALYAADWLFAAAAPMSAINSPPHHYYRQDPDILTIPIWFFQGGKDTNPLQSYTEGTIAYLRNRGANVRYTLYPNLGHGVWNTAYNEPDFWTWLLSKNKSDIHVYGGGEARICATSGATPGARMYLSDEFYYYQWERDGVIVSQGKDAYSYTATVPGTYRARFSRTTSAPVSDADYNQWSKPVVVGTSAPLPPVVTNTKSVMLPDLNGSVSTELIAPANYFSYRWFSTTPDQANINTLIQSPVITQVLPVTQPSATRTKWNYATRVSDIDGCFTENRTTPRVVWFQDGIGSTYNGAITVRPKVTNFQGSQTGVSDVLLQWADVNWERNYEIWRSPSTTASSNNWTLVTITNEDVALYVDKNLKIGITYYYKIRAISEDSRSDYAPSNTKDSNLPTDNVVVTITSSDTQGPTVPQNLQAVIYDTDVDVSKMIARVSWNPSTDNVGVEKYRISYNGNVIETADASTTIDVPGLDINTNYAFTVRAIDAANNASSASAQVNLFTKMDGVYYIHNTFFYTNMTEIQEPQWNDREFFNHLPNIDIDETTQDSYFLMKFYGYLYVSTPGAYKFRLNHNDGVRLKVNGQKVIEYLNYVQEGCLQTEMNQALVTINLPAGYVPVELRYWQSEDDRCLSWEYTGPDTEEFGTEGGWINIPNGRLTTIFNPVQPVLPSIPENFTVTASGMDNLTLNWTTPDVPAPSFEIYRSLSFAGPWTMIEAASTTSYINNGLVPSTEYFYRIRAINAEGASGYTDVVSAITLDDEIAPTAPTNLTSTSTSLTSAAIAWTGSTDNVEVTGYRIYVKPQGQAEYLQSTVATTYATITGLSAQTNYQVYVTAIDAMGNESDPSNTIHIATVGTQTYYHRTGTINVTTNWGSNSNGNGQAPDNFTTNGYYFNVRFTQSSSALLTVSGTVSKVIIPADVALTFTGSGGVQGNLEMEDNASLTLPNNTLPTFGLLSETSTVAYTSNLNQQVGLASYGNLILSGSATKVFQPGITIVRGNLTVGANVAISGAANNGSTIILYGDLIYQGSPLFTAPGNTVNLVVRKPAAQNLTFTGQMYLNQIIVTEPITVTQSAGGILNLGSSTGGGLSLIDGSSINIPSGSTLKISGAGTINSNGETGKIFAQGGTLDISSSSDLNSRVYFDESIYKNLGNFNVNLTGAGNVQVLNPVQIGQGIKISNGELFSNGNITLISTQAQTAMLHRIEGSGRVVGDVNVQRYVSAKYNTYRYISSPVVGQTVSDWQQFFPITGNFTGASPGSTAPSLYVLGRRGQWVAYPTTVQGGSAAPLSRGVGYAAYIRNADFFTMTSTGEPYQGSIVLPLFPPRFDFDGWNLLGNPYASTIQWNNSPGAWTKNNIANVAAVRNNFSTYTGQFEYYDAATDLSTGSVTNSIAQGQAFYVQVIGESPALTIHEAAKYNGQQELFRERGSDVSHLFIHLKKDDMVDKAIIAFTNLGTDAFQPQFDGPKLKNEGIFNLSTLTNDDVAVAINHMSNAFCDKTFALNIEDVEVGEYALEFPDFSTIQGVGSILLIDHFKEMTTDLRESNTYAFTVTSDSLSFGKERFDIVINRPDLDKGVTASNTSLCYESGKVTLSNTQRGAWYSVLNAEGNEVSPAQTSLGNDLTFAIPTSQLKDGTNIFSLKAGFEGCSSTTLSQTVNIEFYSVPELEISDLSTCLGSSAQVSVQTSSQAVVSYNWYNSENLKIKGFTSSTMETSPVLEEAVYSVAAVLKNGCEGPRQGFVVYPVSIEEPELVFENDTLFATATASEYEWTMDGKIVKVSSENHITGLTPGVYQVTCKNGGCSKASREFAFSGDEDDADIALQYQLFPNPTSSNNVNLKVITRSNEDVLVKVIDVLGREHFVKTFATSELRNSVKISPKNDLRAGVYYLILKQDSRFKEIKFIVKD